MKLGMICIIYLSLINVVAFCCYGIDKRKAIKSKWRIPEARLILLAALGGAFGAALGMIVFHHKTRKTKFRILVPLFLVIWIAIIALCYGGVIDLGW